MISGIWGKTKLVCCNGHDAPQEMYIRQSVDSKRNFEDVFYACPKYNPENREPGEHVCMNRISISEFEKMLGVISDIIVESERNDEIINLTNYRFETKVAKYRVVSHKPHEIVVEALNKKAIVE